MKISIIEQGKKRSFAIPNFLLLNGLALNKLNSITKNSNVELDIPTIPPSLVRKLRKTIRQMRKIHKDWFLVDACSNDGSCITIKL